ncbi:hypothetical protein GJAV_G00270060 [Gymnothorax javanicus]|nr:hypothetical protein GJAV_G00270060 [Gymnothorax javanicus]
MSNETTYDPSSVSPLLWDYILIPFLGFTLFGILASLGAHIRRQRTYPMDSRPRQLEAYSLSERSYESSEDWGELEELRKPLWKSEEEFHR